MAKSKAAATVLKLMNKDYSYESSLKDNLSMKNQIEMLL
jgi:hypothetical protein